MTEQLKQKVLAALGELVERHLDDKFENRQAGSDDGALECLKEARKVKSLIREVNREAGK